MTGSTIAAILILPAGTIFLAAWLAVVFDAGRDHPPRSGNAAGWPVPDQERLSPPPRPPEPSPPRSEEETMHRNSRSCPGVQSSSGSVG
jgi:hypothetical protein